MSILSNIVRNISAPVAKVASLIPTPVAQGVSFVSGQIAQDTQRRKIKRQQEEQRAQIMEIFNQSSIPTIQQNLARTTPVVSTASSGGGFLDTIRGGLREVGGFVSDVFSTGVPQLLGYSRPANVGQQPALTTVTNIGAQESQGSGSIQAGAGSLLAPVLSGARNLLKTPQGQLALGGGAGLISAFMGSDGKQMRITRKMKSQARMVLNMTGGNLSATADMLGIDQNTLVMILLKRFRNDGPVVTKAALRKTKQTIRRLHSMQDVLKSITPTATMRRRAPMKRASTTTLIKN
jgi:hypothetical protein